MADPSNHRRKLLEHLNSIISTYAILRLGRKPTLTHHQQQEAIKRLNAGKATQGPHERCVTVV
jgi:hypothetical protein